MDIKGAISWAEAHPWATGGIVLGGGLLLMWAFGLFSSKAASTSTSSAQTSSVGAFYAAESMQTQASTALAMQQSSDTAATAQATINANANVAINASHDTTSQINTTTFYNSHTAEALGAQATQVTLGDQAKAIALGGQDTSVKLAGIQANTTTTMGRIQAATAAALAKIQSSTAIVLGQQKADTATTLGQQQSTTAIVTGQQRLTASVNQSNNALTASLANTAAKVRTEQIHATSAAYSEYLTTAMPAEIAAGYHGAGLATVTDTGTAIAVSNVGPYTAPRTQGTGLTTTKAKPPPITNPLKRIGTALKTLWEPPERSGGSAGGGAHAGAGGNR